MVGRVSAHDGIEYMDGDGRSLAVETIDEFDLVVAAFELGQEVVAH